MGASDQNVQLDFSRMTSTQFCESDMPLSSTNMPLDRNELEARLHSILGHFFVEFARMDLNLSLRVGGHGTFSEKLERFLNAPVEATNSDDTLCKIQELYMAADSMRELRNRLAHGRWGFLVHLQQVAHVSGYPPGPQDEHRFSFGELDAIVEDAASLSNELGRLAS